MKELRKLFGLLGFAGLNNSSNFSNSNNSLSLEEDREINYIFYPLNKKASSRSSSFSFLPVSNLGFRISNFTPEAILVIYGLIGAVLNASGSVWGFVIWLPGNIGLAILNHKRNQKWQSALFAAYTLTAVWGIVNYLFKVQG